MQAVVYENYGLPEDVLELKELNIPLPQANEILVRIFAASVNFNDWAFVQGKPVLSRLWTGLIKPKHKILGTDIAGQVEAIGKAVTGIQPGDEVFGDIGSYGYGAFAEYVAVPAEAVIPKPANIGFTQAAAVPQVAVTALQGLRHQVQIQPGDKVLINGASGGIGTFAVQLAKAFGAEVTGVCSADNLDLVRSIGADHVINYGLEDFTLGENRYDLILDIVANRSISDYLRVLTQQGAYVAVAYNPQTIFFGSILSKSEGKKASSLMAKASTADLNEVKELIKGGQGYTGIEQNIPIGRYSKSHRSLRRRCARKSCHRYQCIECVQK